MPQEYQTQVSPEVSMRLRDIEDKQRLLKDRVVLIGENLIEEREKTFMEIQEMKKTVLELKSENLRMREFLQRMSEQISQTARKEDLMILQRQFDMFKPR